MSTPKEYMYENYTTQRLKSRHIPLMLTLRSWWPCVRGSKSNEPKGHATTAVGVQIGSFRKKKSTSRAESPLRSWQTIFLWVSATVKSLGVAIFCTIFCTIVSAKHALKRLHLKSVARIDLKLTGFRGSQCTFCRTAWIGMTDRSLANKNPRCFAAGHQHFWTVMSKQYWPFERLSHEGNTSGMAGQSQLDFGHFVNQLPSQCNIEAVASHARWTWRHLRHGGSLCMWPDLRGVHFKWLQWLFDRPCCSIWCTQLDDL